MHQVACPACGAPCVGRTLLDAENVRAACHGDRSYTRTPHPRSFLGVDLASGTDRVGTFEPLPTCDPEEID